MKKWLEKIQIQDNLAETFRFIILVFILNYFSDLLQEVNNELLTAQHINPETSQRQVFNSFNSLIFVQKLAVLFFSWIFLKGKDWFDEMTQSHSNQNDKQLNFEKNRQPESSFENESPRSQDEQNSKISFMNLQAPSFQFSRKTELILGIISFGAIQIFASLQQTLNIYYLIEFKYLSMILIIIVGHLALRNQYNGATRTSLWKKLFYTIPIIVLSLLLKLNLTGITGFYMGNLGSSSQSLTSELIVKIAGAIILDVAFYTILYVSKQIYFAQQNSQVINFNWSKKISSEKILYPVSKSILLCLFVLILLTGELKFLINFIFTYPNSLATLFNLSWTYFLHQYFIYYCLITYDLHVFFVIMGTIGLYGKVWDYLTRFWNSYSLMALGFAFSLWLIMQHAIRRKSKEPKELRRTDEFQEAFSQIKKFIFKAVQLEKITSKKKKFAI